MTVAAWQPAHAYVAGDIVNPLTANGHSYRCSVAGTSAGAEPAWVGRYQNITDNTATWVPYSIITPSQVRTELKLEPEASGATTPAATLQYADSTIGPYILSAISSLEQATNRYLVNRPGATVTLTSNLAATVLIPALRTATSVTYGGGLQVVNAGYWLLPDALQTGVYTGIQFRTIAPRGSGPWYYADPLWWDKNLDSPFYPGNYAYYVSQPNDTIVVGDWGYEPLFEPGNLVHAVEVLSEWYVLRPPAILADSAITPAGGIVSYSQMPPEVQEFVRSFRIGRQAVSVG